MRTSEPKGRSRSSVFWLQVIVRVGSLALLLTMISSTAPMTQTRGPNAFANEEDPADVARFISINGYRFDPVVREPSIPGSLRTMRPRAGQIAYFIVQFDGPVTAPMKRELEGVGAKILHYVPSNAFIVRADTDAIDRADNLPTVRWTGLFHPAYKLSPDLAVEQDAVINEAVDEAFARHGKQRGAAMRVDTRLRVPVRVVSMERAVLDDVDRAVAAAGGSRIARNDRRSGKIRAEMPRPALERLAREPSVLWIEREAPEVLFNDLARWVIQRNDTITQVTPIHARGITGTGQTVTIGDSGIDHQHDAFEDTIAPGPGHRKITAYYIPNTAQGDLTDDGDNHGTHVSGSVAGDDGTHQVYDGDPTGSSGALGPHDGQAFGSFIQVQDLTTISPGIFPPDDFADLYAPAAAAGSFIHTNSWGPAGGGAYTDREVETDDFTFTNDDMLVLFAAGNSGPTPGTVNTHGSAKNVIAVGATANGQNANNFAFGNGRYFSGRGPADDGRLKPDLMAPGESIWSAHGCDPGSQCDDYIQYSGTSMAAPTAAGAAALVRQYYEDGWYPSGAPRQSDERTPSAALIKATLINGAIEMTGADAYANGQTGYPNFNQGWGRIHLENSLFFKGDLRRMVIDDNETGLATGESITYSFDVQEPGVPFEVTVAWSDFPGLQNTTPELVNDLDLLVTAPNGNIYRGNRYTDADPNDPNSLHHSELNSPYPDGLNNVEGVLRLPNVQTGIWRIKITARNVPMGKGPNDAQPFAIVITGGGANESSAWPTFHANSARHGSSPSTFAPPLTRLWAADVNSAALHGGPVVDGGKVYAGSSDGKLRAFDALTGGLIWQRNIGLSGYGHAIPAVVDDVLFTTFIFPWPKVYALDTETGATLWSVGGTCPACPALWNSTAVSADRLFVGTDEDRVMALDTANGSMVWLSDVYDRSPYGAAVSDGLVVFGTMDARVIALNESTGALVWSTTLDDAVISVPLIAQGKVFAPTRSGNMYALNRTNGAIFWQKPDAPGSFGPLINDTPAHDGTRIFFGGSSSEGFWCLNGADGSTVWHNTTVFPAEGSVAFADGYVYATASNGTLVALNASTGALVETETLDVTGGSSSPAVQNGRIWVQNNQADLLAFAGVLTDSDADGDSNGTDCQPANGAIHAGAAEQCNGIDDNCNFSIDEVFADTDLDGVANCMDTDDDADGDADVNDCSDLNSQISHFENESTSGDPFVCADNLDNDCDGLVDLEVGCFRDIDTTNGQLVGPGTVTGGGVADLAALTADGTYESILETGGGTVNSLKTAWTFTTSAGSISYDLVVEGRGVLGQNDAFNVSYKKRSTSGQCSATESDWTPSGIKLVASQFDALGSARIGTPPAGAICVKVEDSIPTGDSTASTLMLDRLFLEPTPACADVDQDGYTPSCCGCAFVFCSQLDCNDFDPQSPVGTCGTDVDKKASAEVTGPGNLVNPSLNYTKTLLADEVREDLIETLVGGVSRLSHTWRVTGVRPGTSYKLFLEGLRPAASPSSNNESFKFRWSTDGVTFTDIPNAIISSQFEATGAWFPFTPTGLACDLYIRVEDMNQQAGQPSQGFLNTVRIDYLMIKTIP